MDPVLFFKCLADDTRLKSVLLIAQQGELCVCELMAALDISQPKISRHLAQLRKGGLLSDRKDRQWVHYSLNSALPEWANDLIARASEAHTAWLAEETARLNAMGQRPERSNICCQTN